MESNSPAGSSVYSYYSASGMLVYVGVTDRGIRRLHEHADSKPWWTLVAGCAIEHYGTRDEALDRERALIQAYRPAFNYQHNPDRDLPYEAKVAKCTLITGPQQTREPPPPTPLPSAAVYGLMTLRQRRQFHQTLTREQKRVFPCVICGERPGHQGRPTCMPCITARRERGQAEARRRIALGEERKAQLQSGAVRQLMPTDTAIE